MTATLDLGPIWCGSGTLNFFGGGWWYHRYLEKIFSGFAWSGITFVSKTTTLHRRDGNMPLTDDLEPREVFPRCISIHPLKGVAMNSVALSGPGAHYLLEYGAWETRTEPFVISFMAVGSTRAARVEELRQFLLLLAEYLPRFRTRIVLQINFSCPNVEHGQGEADEVVAEIIDSLDVVHSFGLTAMPKLNVLFPPDRVSEFSAHPACYGVCVSNTIPYRKLDRHINWQRLFGDQSPIRRRGLDADGGLSGKKLLPLSCAWVSQLREEGDDTYVNGGGGILGPDGVDRMFNAGANSVFISSIAMLRPWLVQPAIQRAYERAGHAVAH